MPAMPRWNSKAKKIAFSIMGPPPNQNNIKDKGKKKRDERLTFEETVRVR
jgi:hypothetical protein